MAERRAALAKELKARSSEKEQMAREQKGSFEKREHLSQELNRLDRELFRLNDQMEKLERTQARALTGLHVAGVRTDPPRGTEAENPMNFPARAELKKRIAEIKEETPQTGKCQRQRPLKSTKACRNATSSSAGSTKTCSRRNRRWSRSSPTWTRGMKKQFAERFADIQGEFDRAFKELFGGGRGTLELAMEEDQDILECGVRIIAQPPGKKLQNMMQLSGGEKALTAIALLFAIQNLKPSPFCLLDEIEAALDDSNVDRFAKYLHKLTRNTQFIVITHRRGTHDGSRPALRYHHAGERRLHAGIRQSDREGFRGIRDADQWKGNETMSEEKEGLF